MGPTFNWFDNRREFEGYANSIKSLRMAAEDHIATLKHFTGYCWICNSIHCMLINSGAMFGDKPNLREGLLCEGCGLSNRKRLVYCAAISEYASLCHGRGSVLLAEAFSPLMCAMSRTVPELIGSEYLGPDKIPGNQYKVSDGKVVPHESLTDLSFSDESLKMLVHLDILEHVPDYRAALRECYRVLCHDGSMIFTCPFFATRDETLVRARFGEGHVIEHLETPEWHGDPLSRDGILAWYHYGWDLLEELSSAGFSDISLGCAYDVFSGFISNGFPGDGYGMMLPIVIRARKHDRDVPFGECRA